MKILVVDDEPDFISFVAEALTELGHEVVCAGTPDEFAARYSSDLEVCFVDLFMPGLDGIEVVRFLSDNRSPAAIVYMSGKDASILHAARELAMERGLTVLGLLPKPFTIADIRAVLQRYQARPDRTARVGGDAPGERDVERALAHGELWLAYQPQMCLRRRVTVGVEALLRWRHPDLGTIEPGCFMPMIEASDLIVPVTDFVVEQALRDLSGSGVLPAGMRVSVNVSALTVSDLDLPERLADRARANGVDPSRLAVEITETAVMSDVPQAIDSLTRLRMKGFNLSIDDFGTGYSSMEQLVRIPFDELKIDQRFVRHLVDSDEHRTVAEIAVLLGHKLKMRVVAEGIEDESTLDALKGFGCDIGQGFGIARPMPVSELAAWLSAHPA